MADIFKAEQTVIQDIINIENASFSCPWSEKAFTEALNNKNIAVYIISEGKTVYGFYCLMTVEDEAELLNIAVTPSHRNNGYGQMLLSHAIMYAKEKRINNIYLEVRESNITARGLYEKFGFTKIGVRKRYYSRPIEDAILMLKTL